MKVKRELNQFNSFYKYGEFKHFIEHCFQCSMSLHSKLKVARKEKNRIEHTCDNFIKKSDIPFLLGFCNRHATESVTCHPEKRDLLLSG